MVEPNSLVRSSSDFRLTTKTLFLELGAGLPIDVFPELKEDQP